MFFVKSGCLFIILLNGIHCQMDVTLKRKPSLSSSDEKSPSKSNFDIKNENIPSATKDLLQRQEKVQNDLRKIGVQMDPEMNNFDLFPHPLHPSILDRIMNEQRQTQDVRVVPTYGISLNSDDSDEESSEEDNPLADIMKFMKTGMPFSPFGQAISFDSDPVDQKVPLKGPADEDIQPVGVLTIIKIDKDTPMLQDSYFPTKTDGATMMDSDMESSLMENVMNSFMSTMRDMVNLVQNTTVGLRGDENNKPNGTKPRIDIKIKDHGRTYDIPTDAFIERTDPDLVNITWRSELKDMNNSLCMNVSKDDDGHIVFHHIRLRMLNGQGLQEYNKEDPVLIGQTKENSTEINLADGVGLRFPHPDSLDVVVVEKRGKFSAQWLAVSIALLGLIVAGLVMLLSYILHSRNSYYTRKDSMAKEPIA